VDETLKNLYALNLDYEREKVPYASYCNYKLTLLINDIKTKALNKKIVLDYQDNLESFLTFCIIDTLSPFVNNEVYIYGKTYHTHKYLKKRNKHYRKIKDKSIKREDIFVVSPFNPICYVLNEKKTYSKFIADYYPIKDMTLKMMNYMLKYFYASNNYNFNNSLLCHFKDDLTMTQETHRCCREDFLDYYKRNCFNFNNNDIHYSTLIINCQDKDEDYFHKLTDLINRKDVVAIYCGEISNDNQKLMGTYIKNSINTPRLDFNYFYNFDYEESQNQLKSLLTNDIIFDGFANQEEKREILGGLYEDICN
jgi:hypothetical protein